MTESKLAHSGQNRPKDIRRHASDWVQNHQQLVDSWLEDVSFKK